jgi:lysophospholipase L1-like esterase
MAVRRRHLERGIGPISCVASLDSIHDRVDDRHWILGTNGSCVPRAREPRWTDSPAASEYGRGTAMRRLLVSLTLTSLVAASFAGAVRADEASATTYYLAMGDSLAQGAQPDDSYPPYYQPDGYVPQLYAALSADDPELALDNISCGGESTVSMIYGSQLPTVATSCGTPAFYRYWYPHKTQLAEAASFLAAHKSKVGLVTIDIGGNDLSFCLFVSTDAASCLAAVYPTVATNLDQILDDLQAAGPGVPIIGMTYYNPVACLHYFGDSATAVFVSAQVQTLNAVLESVYAAHGVPVADVAGAFHVGDGLAREATAAWNWTWFCSSEHFGDIHPNDAGYQVIEQAFEAALGS